MEALRSPRDTGAAGAGTGATRGKTETGTVTASGAEVRRNGRRTPRSKSGLYSLQKKRAARKSVESV